MNKPWFLYVVRCNDGSLYCGVALNVAQRTRKHNQGKGAKYTKARRPVELVYQLEHPDKSSALKAEYAFKQLSREEKLHQIGRIALPVERPEQAQPPAPRP